MNKKGVLGLDTAKAFILMLLILAVVGFAALISLSQINDASDNVLPDISIAFVNVSLGTNAATEVPQYVTTKGGTVYSPANYYDCTLKITEVINRSVAAGAAGWNIAAGNYTNGDCTLRYTHAANSYANNSLWNVTGSITYRIGDVAASFQNVTTGTSNFFANATTWFTLISVVVIILLIGIVIFAVSRFGGRGTAV